MADLTHFSPEGAARMVDVGGKAETDRVAVASGAVEMEAATLARIVEGRVHKGDVLQIARIAAIAGTKRTADLIPLCHPVRVTSVDVELSTDEAVPADDGGVLADEGGAAPRGRSARVTIRATVRAHDRTGVEMEALTAVTAAALVIYDMCKAVDRGMRITDVRLEQKSGGRSGDWVRAPDAAPRAP